jgi:NitT/TauT family transport system permease protein
MKPPDAQWVYKWLLPCTILVGILIVWEVAGRIGLLNPLFFPVPSLIFKEFYLMVKDGEIQVNLSITLLRIFAGFLIGAISGLVIGLWMGTSEKVRILLDPVISATYPIPKLAIFPLLMVIFGIGELSKIMAISKWQKITGLQEARFSPAW